MNFKELMKKYRQEIKKFGFQDRSIDWSGIDLKKVKYLCKSIKKYNKKFDEDLEDLEEYKIEE